MRITLIRDEAGGHRSSDAEPDVFTREVGTMRSSAMAESERRSRPSATTTLYRGERNRLASYLTRAHEQTPARILVSLALGVLLNALVR